MVMILPTEIEFYSKDLYVRESHIKVKYIIIAKRVSSTDDDARRLQQ